ncbi:hypothetical protein LCGC14_1478250 [marine sediment metagenome]|uniref:Uncharacterized protein n=1 Tax=marine sediment metagenome TaxID=412755 RepID=A0A0F9JAC0_9ZZZZ
MMVEAVLLGCHLVITLGVVFAIAVRNEHRLTKIETDVSWVKQRVQWELERENAHGKRSTVD